MQLKNLIALPDIVLRLFSLISAPVFHNLDKSRMLRLVFWHLAIDQVVGCYVEFGVASGNSMRSAELAEQKSFSKSLGVSKVERRLFGFDTFDDFKSTQASDLHPTWNGSNFSVSMARVERRFRRIRNRVQFHKVDASVINDSMKFSPISELLASEEAIAIALFDMDLAEPTYQALLWIRPLLVSGTIIIFDEFLGYKGDGSLGESSAWTKFLAINPEISYREYLKYGDGGVAFQIKISG